MPARRYALILAVLLIPAEAGAHLHKAGLFAARSWNDGSTLGGFQFSGELRLGSIPGTPSSKRPLLKPLFSLFGDLGAGWGAHGDGERTQAAAMLGISAAWREKRIQPSLHLGYAYVRTQDSAPSAFDSASGLDVGAALSIGLGSYETLFVRVQYDHVFMSDTDRLDRKFGRVSVGIELRFLPPPRCPRCP
jgi:hypothetical protein